MFYVVDLSQPRKFIQRKYNDFMLDVKLNPPKINKGMVTAAALGIVLVGSTAHAGAIDQGQFNYLVNHYVNDLKYPHDTAVRLLNSLTVTDFEELYARVQHHDVFVHTPMWANVLEFFGFI